MSIYIREARMTDLNDLYELAKQFVLLNLPANKKKLEEIIETSELSFSKSLPQDKAEYLFVAEDTELNQAVATSKIVAKHGTKNDPHLYYKVEKKEKFSTALGIGFIHQVLKFKENADGPTELGGLIVDKHYRSRPEKIGKTTSLARFMYIAMFKEQFEKKLHTELAPPLTDEGRSEFWEALGRRFTGLPYEEADRISHSNKEFIRSLFPEDEIYLTLLESKARLVVGDVGQETKPAKALMEKFGFKYKNEIDPFDGGPHLGVKTTDAKPIKQLKSFKLKFDNAAHTQKTPLLIGGISEDQFKAKMALPRIEGEHLYLNHEINRDLNFEENQEIFTIPLHY